MVKQLPTQQVKRRGKRGDPALDESGLAELHRLRGQGWTQCAIARHLGVSQPTIARALRGPGATAGSPRVKRRPPSPETRQALAAAGVDLSKVPSTLTVDEQRVILSSLLRGVAEDTERARAAGEVATAAATTRLAGALSTALARLTAPETPPDPNDSLDMIAAAERGETKLRQYLELARQGKAPGRVGARPSSGSRA